MSTSTDQSVRSPVQPSVYRTTDLHLASWLSARGHVPSIEGDRNQRVFSFRNVPPEDLDGYFASPCPLSPAALFSSYGTLRKRMFSVTG